MQVTIELVMEVLASVESTIRARFAHRLGRMNQRFDLDDLFQTVAMKAIEGIDGCRAQTMDELRHWILTIAKYTCESAVTHHLGAAKRSLRVESVVVGQATDESRDGYQPATGDEHGIDAAIVREEMTVALAMLDRMSALQRTAVTMAILEEREYSEIAEVMGISYGAVRSLISRGLAVARKEAATQPSLF